LSRKMMLIVCSLMIVFIFACGKNTTDVVNNIDATIIDPDNMEDQIDKSNIEGSVLSIEMASGTLLNTPQNYLYFEYDSEFGIPYAYKVLEDVTNFKLFNVIFSEVKDDGTVVYNRGDELFSVDRLTPKTPLVAKMYILGPIPSFAVSFFDSEGNEHTYAVGESGEDGEPYLQPMGVATNCIIQ